MVIILLISTLFYFHFYACYDKRNNKRGLRFSMYDGITMDGSMQLLLFAFSASDDWDIHQTIRLFIPLITSPSSQLHAYYLPIIDDTYTINEPINEIV